MANAESNVLNDFWFRSGVMIGHKRRDGHRTLDPMPPEVAPVCSYGLARQHFNRVEEIARAANAKTNCLVFATVTMDQKIYGMLSRDDKERRLRDAILNYQRSLGPAEWFAGMIEYTAQHVPHFHFISNATQFYKFKDAFGPMGALNRRMGKNFQDSKSVDETWSYIFKEYDKSSYSRFITNIPASLFETTR